MGDGILRGMFYFCNSLSAFGKRLDFTLLFFFFFFASSRKLLPHHLGTWSRISSFAMLHLWFSIHHWHAARWDRPWFFSFFSGCSKNLRSPPRFYFTTSNYIAVWFLTIDLSNCGPEMSRLFGHTRHINGEMEVDQNIYPKRQDNGESRPGS